MSAQSRMKRIEKAQMRVLFTTPFFAPGVAKLPVEFDETVETACTNGERIKFGTAFCDKLTDAELVTVLCHEVWHCLAGHLWRAPSGADWDTWNQATDHETNTMLKEFSAGVMAKNLADPFPFPQPAEAYCADPQFTGMAAEVIYQRLASQKLPGGSGGGTGKDKGGKVAPRGNSAPNSKAKAGSMPSFGQIEQPKPGAAGATKQLANDWQATLIQSAKLASGQGTLPGSLGRLIEGIVSPKINWVDVLRSWLREQCADDWDFLTASMEFEGCGFILPSLKSEKMGPVVFATDTSGSINNELLATFRAEKQSCLDEMRPSKLVDIYCDASIQAIDEYSHGDTIGSKAPGGGGTSFVPVWQHIENMAEKPKCVVYLTDLMGDFGADPGVPIIWVTWEKNGKAPFGEVVYAEQ